MLIGTFLLLFISCYSAKKGRRISCGNFVLRLRIVRLLLNPSCVMQEKTSRKKWPREILGARSSRALLALKIARIHAFTHDELSKKRDYSLLTLYCE